MFISCLAEQVEVSSVWPGQLFQTPSICVHMLSLKQLWPFVSQNCVSLLMKQFFLLVAPGADVEPAGHLQPINLPKLFSHA